jgi:hypothetical protein
MGTLPFRRPGFTPGAKSRFKPIGPAVDQVKPAFSQQTINDLIAQFQRAEPMPGQATAQTPTPANYYYGQSANPQADVLAAQNSEPIRSANTQAQMAGAANTLAHSGQNADANLLNRTYAARTGSADRTTPGEGDVMDGFARRYVPDQIPLLMANPELIAHDYLGQDGKANYLNAEGDLAPYAGDALDLYNLLIGGNMDPKANANDSIINWMASLFGNLTTPGGAVPTTQQMLGQLYAGLNDPKSAIYKNTMLDGSGTPLDTGSQISAIMKMIPLLGEFSNPAYASAMKASAGQLAREYASNVANGKAGGKTFAQYLQDNFLR